MKKKVTLAILVFLTLSVSACLSAKKKPFKPRDIVRSQRLIGLQFKKAAIDTLYPYLRHNLQGYDSLRKYPLDNEVFPALLFDPHPRHFVMPEVEEGPEWQVAALVPLPEQTEALAFYSIRQLAWLIKNRKITSEALTSMYLERIKRYDPVLRCVVTLTEELALEQAKRADREIAAGQYRGLLHGIPYGVKDLVAVAGYPTTWGAVPYRGQFLDYTATVVKKLEAAGAVLVAKLTTGALARGDVWFGGKTKNPWDLNQGASGSSAGSASATAAGLIAFSLGTETLGSIVAPSQRCGVTGLRPTYGRVSRHGVMSLSWSMDKIGPICRNAEDCAIVFDAIYGADEKDPTLTPAPFNFNPDRDPAGLRVGYIASLFNRDTTAARPNRLQALEIFKTMGIQMDSVVLPKTLPAPSFDVILRAEAGAFFEELTRQGEVDELVQQTANSRANSLRQSRFIPAVEYLQANRHRRILIEKMHILMKDLDVLIAPASSDNQSMITNLTGHPSLAIPTGLDGKGHPTGIVLIGNLYDEGSLLELGTAFQAFTRFEEDRPPGFEVK